MNTVTTPKSSHWVKQFIGHNSTLDGVYKMKEPELRSQINRSLNFYILATWCEELTHLKRPWCWERLKAGGERDDRGWDDWMASPIQWTWVWVNSGSWWWTGRPGMLQFVGSQRVGHEWATALNWVGKGNSLLQFITKKRAWDSIQIGERRKTPRRE